jgi:hypothetical protein
MNKLILLYISLSIYSCKYSTSSNQEKNKQNRSKVTEKLYDLDTTSITEFNFAKNHYIDDINYDTLNIKKVNGTINLPLDKKNVSFTSFSDSSFSDSLSNSYEIEIEKYNYVGKFDEIGLYIVEGLFWEHFEYYLIDKKSGKKTTLWNKPIISPEENFIANLSMPYGLEGIPNGIQIWKINYKSKNKKKLSKISKIIEIDQQKWVPINIFWKSDSSLILKVISVENFLETNGDIEKINSNDYYYLRLNIHI